MKEEGTSGYRLVTHHHTEAQPCFSLYPQLTPLSDALCSQTHRTLGKIENKVGLRERAARQAGDLRGSVSADRHASGSAALVGSDHPSPPGARLFPQRGCPRAPRHRASLQSAPAQALLTPPTRLENENHSSGRTLPLCQSSENEAIFLMAYAELL